ncbi:MAG: formylglycine-generating enzyme family protein [Planctomycetes bacterium]|nr:formylglycine-generating enzyme family protein [Planctomycetota bacterium]
MKRITILLSMLSAMILAGATRAEVVMDLVTVGDRGNRGELSGEGVGGWGPNALVGGVDYVYDIGKFEVTVGQYTEFLNAVAADDTHGLYNASLGGGWQGIGGITRTGSSGSYTYSVRADRGNRPVNYVGFYDALRFANWMHNGQPSGAQDTSTTEDGAYDMSLGVNVARNPEATWVIPTEHEWYKAAYYKGGGTDAGYWDYATQSDTVPAAELPPGTNPIAGSANYNSGDYLDTTYYLTEVGAYTNKPSDSTYGTFDQNGNVWEWNETLIELSRGLRGGSFCHDHYYLHAAYRIDQYPVLEYLDYGFRVARVPEPAALALLAVGAVALVHRRKR